MKMKTTMKRICAAAAKAAIALAVALGLVQTAEAARNWTGNKSGDFSNNNNWSSTSGRRYFKKGNLTGGKSDLIYLSANVTERENTGLCFYDVPDRGYWRFHGSLNGTIYTFNNSDPKNGKDYDVDSICIGYSGNDSSVRIYAINLITRHLSVGGDASLGTEIVKYNMTGHLILDDLNNQANSYLGPVNITATKTVDLFKGDLYSTNANITCSGNMQLVNFTAE